MFALRNLSLREEFWFRNSYCHAVILHLRQTGPLVKRLNGSRRPVCALQWDVLPSSQACHWSSWKNTTMPLTLGTFGKLFSNIPRGCSIFDNMEGNNHTLWLTLQLWFQIRLLWLTYLGTLGTQLQESCPNQRDQGSTARAIYKPRSHALVLQ